MDRRRFVAMIGSALAAPLALAQAPGRVYRVGVFLSAPESELQPHLAALRGSLAHHGFAEGRNLQLVIRVGSYYDRSSDEMKVRDMVAQRVDVVIAFTTILARTARAVAGSTPVVFTIAMDAAGMGLVDNLRKPGGTMTGVTWRGREIHAKRLELLREALPGARRVAFAYWPGAMATYGTMEAHLRETAKRLRLELIDVTPESVTTAFSAGAEAIFVFPVLWPIGQQVWGKKIVLAAQARKLPSFFPESQAVAAGALMSYGPDFVDEVRRAAEQVAQILKGTRAGELAVDQASRFQLVINRKTAQALGIPPPQSLLVRADRVIE